MVSFKESVRDAVIRDGVSICNENPEISLIVSDEECRQTIPTPSAQFAEQLSRSHAISWMGGMDSIQSIPDWTDSELFMSSVVGVHPVPRVVQNVESVDLLSTVLSVFVDPVPEEDSQFKSYFFESVMAFVKEKSVEVEAVCLDVSDVLSSKLESSRFGALLSQFPPIVSSSNIRLARESGVDKKTLVLCYGDVPFG